MLVSEETGALQAIVYIYYIVYACQVKTTRSVPEVRGRFQSRLRSLYYLVNLSWRINWLNSHYTRLHLWRWSEVVLTSVSIARDFTLDLGKCLLI